MNKFILPSFLAPLFASAAFGAIVQAPLSPMMQGGMVHINVTFFDQPTGTFDIHTDAGTPLLQPHSIWSPGDTFDPADPWFTTIDPTQAAGLYSSRYGFLIDAASDPLPLGKSLGIRMTSASPGLQGYFIRTTASSELFDPVFVTPGDDVLWTGAMWHTFFVANSAGPKSATFEFFLADASPPAGAVGYPFTGSYTAGYELGSVTLNWNAVPEPSTYALLGAGAAVLAMAAWRRRNRTP